MLLRIGLILKWPPSTQAGTKMPTLETQLDLAMLYEKTHDKRTFINVYKHYLPFKNKHYMNLDPKCKISNHHKF